MTLFFFVTSAAIAWSFEQAGVLTGAVYGPYHYTEYLGPKLGEVPLAIPMAWFMMIYPSYVIANLILSGRSTGTAAGIRNLLALTAASAVFMTAWDLVIDPILSGPSVRAWIWEAGGPYFGVPLQNYAGWLLTTFTVYLVFRFVEQRRAQAMGAPPEPARLVAALPVAIYGLMLVSELVSGAGPAELAVIGPLVMGPQVAAAAWRLRTMPVGGASTQLA
jgi:putative membrane protein